MTVRAIGMSSRTRLTLLMLGSSLIWLSACSPKREEAPPPRVGGTLAMPNISSTFAVPIDADLTTLARGLDKELPRTLWSIDRRVERCLPPQKIKLLGARLKVTPAIACALTGSVTRGGLTVRGHGRLLIVDVPLMATITARDAGRVLKGETATGAARAEARITLDLARDWTPQGHVQLQYDWTQAPGVTLLGHRITFADKADEKLRPLVRRLEDSLPRELAKLDLRKKADGAWRSAFTVLSLNDDDPPVWLRVVPERIMFGGYTIANDRIRLDTGIEAQTATFVGPRPPAAPATPLPLLAKEPPEGGLHVFVPVTAAYRELEPVILRALVKRSARPFQLPGIGAVKASFQSITAYGTTAGHIAVGIDLSAARTSDPTKIARGRIWLVARPVNQPGSARLSFSDLTVQGHTDRSASNLLITLGRSPYVTGLVASALDQDLDRDLQDLIAKIRHAIAYRREGAFIVRATLDRIETGSIQAAGDGLHLPVRAAGTADVDYTAAP